MGPRRDFVAVCVWYRGVVVCEEGEEDRRWACGEVVDAAEGERAEYEGEQKGWEKGRVRECGEKEGLYWQLVQPGLARGINIEVGGELTANFLLPHSLSMTRSW